MGRCLYLINNKFYFDKKPFLLFGKKVEINYILKEEFKAFISYKFEATGKNIEKPQIEMILDITDGHPYFTQLLCFER
jgi:hypothetical protein